MRRTLRKLRKGQWTPTAGLAEVLIGIIVLVVLIVLYSTLTGLGGVDKEACRQSVQLNGHTKHTILTGVDLSEHIVDPYGNAVELQCETEYLTVHGDEPEELKKKVADSMVDCWQMYGEGELEIFDTRDGNYCAICSQLEFEEMTVLPGFTDYLMDTTAPRNELTYFEYFKQGGKRCGGKILSERDTPDVIEGSDLNNVQDLDTSSPLAVIFVLGKNAYPNGFIQAEEFDAATTGAIWGGGLGGVGGAIAIGIALCSTGAGCTIGAPLIIAVIGGGIVSGVAAGTGAGLIGYGLGSSCTANYDAYVVLWNYSDLGSLDCTYLEGEGTNLEVKDI